MKIIKEYAVSDSSVFQRFGLETTLEGFEGFGAKDPVAFVPDLQSLIFFFRHENNLGGFQRHQHFYRFDCGKTA